MVSKEDRWGTDLDCDDTNKYWAKSVQCLTFCQDPAQTMDTIGLTALPCLGQGRPVFSHSSSTGKSLSPL